MPDLADAPIDWSDAQLEFIDQQLANYVKVRARHREDIRLYAHIEARLPMLYHIKQVTTCSTRIQDLLDMRLRLMAMRAQEEVSTDGSRPAM